MIQHVVEHVGMMENEHIFLCQKTHIEKYKLYELFASFLKNFKIVDAFVVSTVRDLDHFSIG